MGKVHGHFFSGTTSDKGVPTMTVQWCHHTCYKKNGLHLKIDKSRLLASPTVHARLNTVLKVMKWISIPHHDCSPNYLGIELCGIMAIFTNQEIFQYSEWSTVSCVDDPQCNSQLLAMVTHMQHLFFFFHIICSTNSVYETYPASCTSSAQISIISGWSWLSTTNICTSLLSTIQVDCNPGATQLFLHSSFLSLPFNILTEMPVANSSTWPAAFSGSNLRAHSASCSPIPTLLWILQAAPSKTFQAVIYRTSPRSYSLPPIDTHHGQGGRPCRRTAPTLQKSRKLCSFKHNSAGWHPPNLHGCKLTEDTQKWYHLTVHVHTSVQNV